MAPPCLFHRSGLLTSLPVADWNQEEVLKGRMRILSCRHPWVPKDLLLLMPPFLGRSPVARHPMRRAQAVFMPMYLEEADSAVDEDIRDWVCW